MTVTALDTKRAVTIGGSSAAAACGIDPHCSRVMLWAQLTGRVVREPTEAMRWGSLLEPVIVDALREDGHELIYPYPRDDGASDPERPWLHGHPDGLAVLREGTTALLEVKTANVWTGREWHDAVPLHYVAQSQVYLHLLGLDRALFACLVGGQRLVTRTLDRDDAAIALLLDLAADFMDYVRADTPPAPDASASSREALAAMYPAEGAGGTVRLTREQMEWVADLKLRKAQLAVVKEQVAELENRLRLVMGEATTALSPHDETVVRWTPTKATRIDAALLKETRPELASLFTVTTETRRFSVV